MVYGLTGTRHIHTHTSQPGVLDDTNGATDADGVYRCTHTHTHQVNIHIILDSHYTQRH